MYTNQKFVVLVLSSLLVAGALLLGSFGAGSLAVVIVAVFITGLVYENLKTINFFFQVNWLRVKLRRKPGEETWRKAGKVQRIAYVSLLPIDGKVVGWVAKDLEPDVCLEAGRHTDNPDLLEQLAKQSLVGVLEVVGRNTNTSGEVLRRLSETGGQTVRWQVMANPSCPVDLLEQCVLDATRNSAGHPDIYGGLGEAVSNVNMPTRALEHLVVFGTTFLHRHDPIREELVNNPNCPEWLADEIALDRDPKRAVLSRHLNEDELEVALGLLEDWSDSLTSLLDTTRNICSHTQPG